MCNLKTEHPKKVAPYEILSSVLLCAKYIPSCRLKTHRSITQTTYAHHPNILNLGLEYGMMRTMMTTQHIERWLTEHKGILVAKSAIVHRNTYFGNDIIAKNSALAYADNRGYVPVELWIMSMVEAENTIRLPEEGLTKIKIYDEEVTLKDICANAESLLFGTYATSWPLTKILDIGGTPIATSFGTREVPPIPVHVHPHKTEAYFFPPTNVPPYNKELSVTTRIGLKEGVTREEFMQRLARFGKDDSMFELLNEFPIKPGTGWTVLEKTLHAPGPHVTFEIQRPSDDYHNASWRLGERLEGKEQAEKYEEHVVRGISDINDYIDTVLNWEHTTDQTLKERYFHMPHVVTRSDSGTRYQIFFDMFYGEGWEIPPHATLHIPEKETPQAGVVWSGRGTINENEVSLNGNNEFLIVPHTKVTVTNSGDIPLLIYTTEPIRP